MNVDRGFADTSPELRLAADRWSLWCTISRGLAHQLANASQMLALEPAPPMALEEARERVTRAMAALTALRPDGEPGPTLLSAVVADVDLLQRLQMEFPATVLRALLAPDIPPLGISADDLLHALLGLVTLAKRGVAERRPELRLEARAERNGVLVSLADAVAGDGAPGRAELEWLVRRAGGELLQPTHPPAIELWLPAWTRGNPSLRES